MLAKEATSLLSSGLSSGASSLMSWGSSLFSSFGGSTSASVCHSGGVVGETAYSRSIPALAFAGAPRLHSGLASDEFAAILQKGETVIPKGKTAVANKSNVISIPLTVNGGSKKQAAELRRELESFVEKKIKKWS